MKPIGLLFLAIAASSAHANGYVPPERAFGFYLSATGQGSYALEADVMPGFALYQDKLKLSVEGAKMGRIRMPAGEAINDPELGPEMILTGHVSIPIAVRLEAGHAAPTLIVKYQGCQVDQMCYPPQTIRFDLGQ